MKKITTLNSKGGVGKSTLTWHMAVACEEDHPGEVVICDTDPQSSLADWWNRRNQDTPQLAMVKLSEFRAKQSILAAKYNYMFLDTAAANDKQYAEILKEVDLIVIPVIPSPVDILSLGRITLPVVHDSGKPFVFVLSKARPSTKLLLSTVTALSEHGTVCQTVIQQREGYAKTALTGSTILEEEPDGKGAAEIRELWRFIQGKIDYSTKRLTKKREPWNV